MYMINLMIIYNVVNIFSMKNHKSSRKLIGVGVNWYPGVNWSTTTNYFVTFMRRHEDTGFSWDFLAIFCKMDVWTKIKYFKLQNSCIAPKSLIFMRRYKDTDLPWDFLTILYKMEASMNTLVLWPWVLKFEVFDLRLWFKIGSNRLAKVGWNAWEKEGRSIW